MGIWSTIAGVGDTAAGNFDESVSRQFDDEQGGGFADWDTWTDNQDQGPIGDAAEGWTRFIVSPHVTGAGEDQVVEDGLIGTDPENTTSSSAWWVATTGETFDDEPGGGFSDPSTWDPDNSDSDQPAPLEAIARFLQLLTEHGGKIVVGIVALVVIQVVGNLFTFNIGDSDS